MDKKILIVDDEVALANALDAKLRSVGFKTKVVTDGQAALDAIGTDDYALVLLDLVMPRLDGFKVVEQARASGSEVKIVVFSNLSQEDDIARVKPLVDGFYVKSDTPIVEIIKRIKELTS